MTRIPPILESETFLATVLIALLAIAGDAHGTVAILTIGAVQIIDLPALVKAVCEEAREGCQT